MAKTVARHGGVWKEPELEFPKWRWVTGTTGKLGKTAHMIETGKPVCGAKVGAVVELTTVLPAECCWCKRCLRHAS